eukprot:5007318-Prymnesium_polylepis.1
MNFHPFAKFSICSTHLPLQGTDSPQHLRCVQLTSGRQWSPMWPVASQSPAVAKSPQGSNMVMDRRPAISGHSRVAVNHWSIWQCGTDT